VAANLREHGVAGINGLSHAVRLDPTVEILVASEAPNQKDHLSSRQHLMFQTRRYFELLSHPWFGIDGVHNSLNLLIDQLQDMADTWLEDIPHLSTEEVKEIRL